MIGITRTQAASFDPMLMMLLRLFFFLACVGRLAASQAAVFEVEPGSSTAYFEVEYFGNGRVKGELSNIKGTAQMDGTSKKGVVDMTFDMSTVETGRNFINRLIKSRHIFDTVTYPTMLFHSTQFEFRGEQMVAAKGDLTLHGVTRPVDLDVKNFACSDTTIDAVPARRNCNGDFHTTILRSQFGMNNLSLIVNDNVSITVQLTLKRLDENNP